MRVAFGVVTTLCLLFILFSFGSLVLEGYVYEIDFLKTITEMLFAVSLVVISGFITLIKEVIDLNI